MTWWQVVFRVVLFCVAIFGGAVGGMAIGIAIKEFVGWLRGRRHR